MFPEPRLDMVDHRGRIFGKYEKLSFFILLKKDRDCTAIRQALPLKDVELLSVSRGDHKDIRRLQHPSYGDRLRDLGLFNLEKTLERPHCNIPVLEWSLHTGGRHGLIVIG